MNSWMFFRLRGGSNKKELSLGGREKLSHEFCSSSLGPTQKNTKSQGSGFLHISLFGQNEKTREATIHILLGFQTLTVWNTFTFIFAYKKRPPPRKKEEHGQPVVEIPKPSNQTKHRRSRRFVFQRLRMAQGFHRHFHGRMTPTWATNNGQPPLLKASCEISSTKERCTHNILHPA